MKPEEPKTQVSSFEEAKRRLRWKKLFAKKWFFPAVYIAAAALILSLAWWYQQSQTQEVTKSTKQWVVENLPQEKVPTNPTDDDLLLPVAQNAGVEKTVGFYEETASKKGKETALVKYANSYWPHTGIDFARKDGKTFDVLAALEGKVVRVEENPIVGYQVEIEHESGITTVYQSLTDVKVSQGQSVKKGQVIAKAGRNQFEKDAGVHLHFEIRDRKQQAMNPMQYYIDLK